MQTNFVEVTFKGEAAPQLSAEFDCDVVIDRGVTRLRVPAGDAPALHGLLAQLGRLGLEVIDVRRIHAPPDGDWSVV